MLPQYKHGSIVIVWNKASKPGDVVVATLDGKEIIKRIAATKVTTVYLLGDNPSKSTDSRTYG
ncbi:MAG: S26 family signal peptidase, partial [Gammaproteobacteria bacterium]|nr:S26 family signal peptidase [Gammaproteobacteria bacterium]